MAKKSTERRKALRDRLIDAAQATIAKGGLGQIKARDLAAEAGCSVGAIYNVFDDLSALILEVNGRTFQALGRQVAASQEGLEACAPVECLIRMSHAYLDFAVQNTRLWQALFEVEMSTESDVPRWYLDELARLFAHIRAPLARRWPDRSEAELDLLTRGLFSSVHGIVLLGLQNRISGVPRDEIAAMIRTVLKEVCK
ncbi:MAG TPA: TetR/AcrR family transcriptional regulator [Aliiroseovarius sp.]|nr:TetR/AcrR family transcriptional regulator [Aliiroseovarius sp.]